MTTVNWALNRSLALFNKYKWDQVREFPDIVEDPDKYNIPVHGQSYLFEYGIIRFLVHKKSGIVSWHDGKCRISTDNLKKVKNDLKIIGIPTMLTTSSMV